MKPKFELCLIFVISFLTFLFYPRIISADSVKTISDFKVSYATLMNYLKSTDAIQVKGNQIIFSEFPDSSNFFYPGHLGSWWSPPFYSTYFDFTKEKDPLKGFFTSLAFVIDGQVIWEKPADPTRSFWHPSKLETVAQYEEFEVVSKKIPLIDQRGIAHSITIRNLTNKTLNLTTAYLVGIGSINYLGPKGFSWAWNLNSPGDTSGLFKKSGQRKFLFYNKSKKAFIAFFVNRVNSWVIVNNTQEFANEIRSTLGHFSNQNRDSQKIPGSLAAISNDLSILPNQERKICAVFLMGGADSREEAEMKTLLSNDPCSQTWEERSDNYWNRLLTKAKTESLLIAPKYKKLYWQGIVNFLLNRWDFSKNCNDYFCPKDKVFYSYAAGFGQSMAQYNWSLSRYSSLLAEYEPTQLKEQIRRGLIAFSLGCRAYDPIFNHHLCDLIYANDAVSLIRTILDYVQLTKDLGILYEKVAGKSIASWIKLLADYPYEGYWRQTSLVDCGDDRKLYELSIHCNLGSRYNGVVPVPNGDRYAAYIWADYLLRAIGEPTIYRQKAQQVASDLSEYLWSKEKGWFKSFVLYTNSGQKLESPQASFFKLAPTFHLLEYRGLLNDQQINALVKVFEREFLGPYGLTSISLTARSSWCSREDWQGPGLYTGEVGHIIRGFKISGQREKSQLVINKYRYLEDLPFWSEALSYDTPILPLRFGIHANGQSASHINIDASGISYALSEKLVFRDNSIVRKQLLRFYQTKIDGFDYNSDEEVNMLDFFWIKD